MRKTVAMILAALLVLALPLATMADAPVALQTKGVPVSFGDGFLPYITDAGDTMVPLSYLDSLGIWAGWNDQTQTATLINDKIVTAAASGTSVDGAASAYGMNLVVKAGVPFVKLRSASNIFGMGLAWDGATRTVNVQDTFAKPVAAKKELILATTTSTQDSGLLDFLLPEFEKDTGIVVKTVSVGSGAAIKMGADGEADVMLVHSRSQELDAMKAGDAVSRHELMYNDFIIVGPAEDPAAVMATGGKALDAFKAIHDAGLPFVSRGDKSGTDTLEKSLWAQAGITPDPKVYMEAATGMLATLTIAEQKYGYTVTDRATFLKNQDKLSLVILCEGDPLLLNLYSVMVVNPDKNDLINVLAALQFSDWLISPKGQQLINAYGVEEYGKPLFFANFKPTF